MIHKAILATLLCSVAWLTCSSGRAQSPNADDAPSAAPVRDPQALPGGAQIGSSTIGGFFEDADAERQQDQELDRAADDIMELLRQASDEQTRQGLREKLRANVTAQFDVKQKLREKQLLRLEERVKRLRAEHDRRMAAKSVIVEKRLSSLLDETEGLGWSTSETSGPIGTNSTYSTGVSADRYQAR
jgi:hypothetical protein